MGHGSVLEQYKIEALLGEGGMGTVYRALDTRLNRPVAVKFLSNELADTEARRLAWPSCSTSCRMIRQHER